MPNIEVLPPWLFGEVDQRLAADCARARTCRAAVAFWTVPPSFLGADMVTALGEPEGFLCVDIHHPTSIDHLASMKVAGANVYLHLYDLAGHTEDVGVVGMPSHLMHAKMLLFDRADRSARLWVGSHNATQRALLGINIEASVAIEMFAADPEYAQAAATLEAIRARCKPFDVGLVDYYKWLQGTDHSVPVIELEDGTGLPLGRQTISVFGTDLTDHAQLKQVDKSVLVSVSTAGEPERFYHSTIEETGNMKGDRTAFSDRRYAFRTSPALPLLQPPGSIPPAVYKQARYFVTLAIGDALDDRTVGYEVPKASERWITVDHWDGDAKLRGREFSGKKGDRAPRLREAAPPQAMDRSMLALEARKAIKEHRLVRRRVVVEPAGGQ